jgi:hypothetical protein
MTSTLTIVLFALLALLLLLRLAKGHAAGVHSPDDLRAQIRPVNIEAFRNLTDPDEEEFLQTHLKPAQCRRIRRQRLRAVLAYVSCVANNAAVLVRMGEEAKGSPDASVAEAGQKLVDNALRLRLFALQAKGKLYLQLVLPGTRTPSHELVTRYEQMTRQGQLLGRLRYPARGVSAVL